MLGSPDGCQIQLGDIGKDVGQQNLVLGIYRQRITYPIPIPLVLITTMKSCYGRLGISEFSSKYPDIAASKYRGMAGM